MKVKTEACDRLLATRVEVKAKGRKVNEVVNRLHVARPQQRDDKVRDPNKKSTVVFQCFQPGSSNNDHNLCLKH